MAKKQKLSLATLNEIRDSEHTHTLRDSDPHTIFVVTKNPAKYVASQSNYQSEIKHSPCSKFDTNAL